MKHSDNALPGQVENPVDWGAALPDSEWLKIRPGDSVVMTLVARELRESSFKDESTGKPRQEIVCTVLVDGVERKWSPNTGALRELSAVGVREGDTIKVHRFEDLKRGARTYSSWAIEPATDPKPKTTVDAEMDARVKGAADGSDHPFDDEEPTS
jgi:hypothetical protein